MTPDSAPVPAAFNGNKSAAHETAENTRQVAETAGRMASLLAQLPQAIGVMLGQVVRAMPSQPLCAQCLVNRIGWEAAHRGELEAAIEAGRGAHGIPEDAPLPPGFDPAPWLPADLAPGGRQAMPNLTGAITTVNGTATCSDHIPGRPGKTPLLIASSALSPSVMASLRA